MVPRAVLMKSGLVSVNTARQVNVAHSKTIVNVARPMSYLSKTVHSTVKRPIHKNTTFKNNNFNQRVNIVKDKNINIVKPKAVVNAAKPKAVVNIVKGNNVNVVKASACWIQVSDGLGHQNKLIFLTNVLGNPQMDLQDKGVTDSGCSRHMTGNMSYLIDYEEIDGGYVAFGGNPKGGKITRKGGGPNWLFDIAALTKSMNYKPVKDDNVNSTNNVNAASTNEVNVVGGKTSIELPDDLNMPALEDIIYSDDDEDVGTEADMNNLDAFMPVSLIQTTSDTKWYQMDVKSAFLYGKIEEKVYVCQPPRIGDQNSLIEYTCRKGTLWTASSSQSLMISFLDLLRRLQVKQKQDGIFISQDKYVTKILMKFGFTDVKTQDTYGNSNLLLKDEDGEEVDVHLYRSMIGSLMYLTSLRPDIMFAVYGKKIIVAEASVRRGLQLYDEEGTDCLSNDTIFVDSYMGGLESVEARLLVYKKNESVYEEDIKVLKCEIHLREVAITELRRKLELAQKQKDEIQLTVENFENSSKNLSKLIDCQIVDKCKTSLGYNAVPPPYTGNFMPPKSDLSFSGLEEFINEPIVSEPTVKKLRLVKDEAESKPKIEKKTVKPSFAKIEFVKSKKQVKSPRKTTDKQGDQNRLNTHSPRGNQSN
ncbi:hypothetical protein Tco_1326360 [Tanacetum coccineum]